MIRIAARRAFAGAAQLGEGPAWGDGRLLWVDLLSGVLYGVVDGEARVLLSRPEAITAVLPREGGGYALLTATSVELLGPELETERIVPVLPAGGETRLSDGAVGPGGELWFGVMRYDLAPGGALYRLRPGDESAELVDTSLGMPNGIAFSPDGRTAYLVDSSVGAVLSYDYSRTDHGLERPRVVATVDPVDGVPDGIAVDAAGSLWVAHWGGGKLRRLDPDGTWRQEILVPTANVTSCAFGGAELQSLFITTGRVELGPEDLLGQPDAGSVFCTALPVSGAPTHVARL